MWVFRWRHPIWPLVTLRVKLRSRGFHCAVISKLHALYWSCTGSHIMHHHALHKVGPVWATLPLAVSLCNWVCFLLPPLFANNSQHARPYMYPVCVQLIRPKEVIRELPQNGVRAFFWWLWKVKSRSHGFQWAVTPIWCMIGIYLLLIMDRKS